MLHRRLVLAVSSTHKYQNACAKVIRSIPKKSSTNTPLGTTPTSCRSFSCSRNLATVDQEAVLRDFKETFHFQAATCDIKDLGQNVDTAVEKQVVLHGYLGNKRQAGKNLIFVELQSTDLTHVVQVVAVQKGDAAQNAAYASLKSLNNDSPVAITGFVKGRKAKPSSSKIQEETTQITEVEVELTDIAPLNHFPKDIIVTDETVFPPEQRHLQIRNEKRLRDALRFRSRAASIIRTELCENQGFIEVETPLLFKSTPEGAREFLVPTRAEGMAYALPQSPQQYKQILMASGIPRYLQFAKCFRDEDLRADRQPEFTQVDLEMAFATGKDVMSAVERTVKKLWSTLLGVERPDAFPRLTYEEAMSTYGSDKPDRRYGSKIQRIEYLLPVDLIGKIGPLNDPIVEVMKIPISDDPARTRKFVTKFMDSPESKPFNENPDGQPGIFIFDPRRPLSGLQAFGFEAAEVLEDTLDLTDGDLVVLQARPREPLFGGSTLMGNLRLALHKAAVAWDFIPAPEGFDFMWVTDFPLFSPTSTSEPGQGGSAGLSATHHPFTAPKTAEDVDLLLTNPREVKAEHYDLVVNGVELGGGSRRIHSAAVQELVLRDILKMSDERLKDFAHLIEVLRAGCPPHAGLALGFDRLVAVMLGRESVRDVIAFPKSGKGEDLLVKSPSRMTEEQLQTYHLRLRE
ncbi:hypothetical protein AAFC00_000543 [Neodothiora populina]|uniref:Aminoacyl-transfer RNA synthetases class-II family profile domain-containing protein n=1 Tax=Neodothiora populina TaxID=2781224 RepID=A0ABR3PDA8_9PEZI